MGPIKKIYYKRSIFGRWWDATPSSILGWLISHDIYLPTLSSRTHQEDV